MSEYRRFSPSRRRWFTVYEVGVYADDMTSHCFWVSVLGIGVNLDDHWNLVSDSFCENFKNDLLWDHCFFFKGIIVLRAIP